MLMMAKTNSLSLAPTKGEYAKMKDGYLQQSIFLQPFQFGCEEHVIKGSTSLEVISLYQGNMNGKSSV